ncbi:unnamed protein product [Blepharisma stoltei]|uniref:Protein kinase domain-containing protein n=1 Tax=Blepharisma stoltei TaxID=1481888 RepID=A0AAU9IIL0_9CILI|nr:unnamed protein product [Blepharisma stoltei]
MFLSIFRQIDEDANKSQEFWHNPDEKSLSDTSSNKLHQGYLLMPNSEGNLVSQYFILTTTSLYKYKVNSNEIESVSNIRWKILEAFLEANSLETRSGFKLYQNEIFQDFYTENTEELDRWVNILSKVSILTEVEDDYAIIKTLGQGSYATVYLVDDLDSYDNYALKSIDKSSLSNMKAVWAVANEIEILRTIDHHNVTKLYKVYESKSHIHLIMDYAPGTNMLQKIFKVESFSERKASEFLFELLLTLNYLHSKNIVHRDIKLENIMICSENPAKFKLIDFGLAGICNENDQTLRCGSPGYIAPEILRKQTYGVKIDLFGIGVCLFMLLSGRSPFPGRNTKEILKSNKQGIVYFSQKHWKKVSKDAVDLVLKLCQPDPDLRLSAKDALNHKWLKRVKRGSREGAAISRNLPDIPRVNHTAAFLYDEEVKDASPVNKDGVNNKQVRRSSFGSEPVVVSRKVIVAKDNS